MSEDEILADLERHVLGCANALRQMQVRGRKALARELRLSGVLATVRGLRAFLKREKREKEHGRV